MLSRVSDPLWEEEVTLDLDITTRELLASTMLEIGERDVHQSG